MDEAELAERVCHAVSVIAGSGLGPPPAQPLMIDDVVGGEILSWCATDRTEGLTAAALAAGFVARAGPDGNDGGWVTDLTAAFHQGLRQCLLAEETMVRAVHALTAAGLCHRVLKGVATAHLDYADPADRMFGDADVLIERAGLTAALDALRRAGFSRDEAPPRGWWERRFARAVVLTRPNGSELDLHVAIAGGYFGRRLDHGRLWATAGQSLVVGGTEMVSLGADDRLLHACLSAEVSKMSGIRALRDVAGLVLGGQADWRRTIANAQESGVDVVVARAIHRAWIELDLPDHPAHRWSEITPLDSSQVEAFDRFVPGDADSWAVEASGTLAALAWKYRPAFLLGVVAPSRANLQSRGMTRRGHCTKLFRTLAKGRR